MPVTDSVLEQDVIDIGPNQRATRATDACEEVLFVVTGVGELRTATVPGMPLLATPCTSP